MNSISRSHTTTEHLLEFLTSICSQCSHLLGGIGGYLKARVTLLLIKKVDTTTTQESSQESPEQTKEEKLLSLIEDTLQENERLQLYDPSRRELWFACGDGKKAVSVSSTRQLKITVPLSSKLSKELVEGFRQGLEGKDGKELFDCLRKILKEYLHFKDDRLYLFQSLWIVGTYLYSQFSHYGYLFLYSKEMRSGKTRTQEVFTHLSFEATEPLNAPTTAVIRDLADAGGTLQLDTLERWKDKSSESHAAAMELLDAGFRKGGKVAKKVPNKMGSWETEYSQVYTPYVLAAIHKNSLTDTALDRSFPIEMCRKSLSITKEKI